MSEMDETFALMKMLCTVIFLLLTIVSAKTDEFWPFTSALQRVPITGSSWGSASVTSAIGPHCPAHYQVVLNAAGNLMCARDLREPLK